MICVSRKLIVLLGLALSLAPRALAADAAVNIAQTSTGSGSLTISFQDTPGTTFSETVSYGSYSTPASLASAINDQAGALVSATASATASGATISLTSVPGGANTNWDLYTSLTYDSADFATPSYTVDVASGTGTDTAHQNTLASDQGTLVSDKASETAGDNARTEQMLRRAAAEFPEYSRQWTKLALWSLEHGNPDEAEFYARKAISLRPVGKDIPRDFGILSEVALKRGNLAEAELWAKRSVAADGSSPSSHRRLAEVYGAEGLATESRAEGHIASVIDVASEPAVR